MSISETTLKAPAKINLFFEVGESRANGYHEVRGLVAPIGVCDDVALAKTDGPIETVVEPEGVPGETVRAIGDSADNIATKAALLLKEATGHAGGARIRITKRIPVGGGLGGGSTDAAATLRGLNSLWQTGLKANELVELGRKLGSDVPALVLGGMVMVAGDGDEVKRVPLASDSHGSPWWIVVTNPGFAVSTASVYARYSSILTSPPQALNTIVSSLKEGDVRKASDGLFNSLQPTVFAKYPLLAMIFEGLEEAGAIGTMLCGSGASVFCLARDESHASQIAEDIGRAMGPWLWTRVAKCCPIV